MVPTCCNDNLEENTALKMKDISHPTKENIVARSSNKNQQLSEGKKDDLSVKPSRPPLGDVTNGQVNAPSKTVDELLLIKSPDLDVIDKILDQLQDNVRREHVGWGQNLQMYQQKHQQDVDSDL